MPIELRARDVPANSTDSTLSMTDAIRPPRPQLSTLKHKPMTSLDQI